MLKCIAIDDEPLALKQIVRYIDQTGFLELTGQFDNAQDASVFFASKRSGFDVCGYPDA
jgi:DNA-binding LytR/AlgR family response regulator